MPDRPDDARLLQAVRSLRGEVAAAQLALDVDGVEHARVVRRDLLTQLDDYVLPRLADLDAPMLAVVGGSTGAGKSTLVNSLARRVVSRSGVLRPTTRACVLVHHPSDERWFIGPRILPTLARVTGVDHHEDPGTVRLVTSEGLPAGVAVLDAPDIDSVVSANRALARQLLAAADLWVFVTTAARYADAVPWQLLRQAVDRGTSVAMVLDRVPAAALDEIGDHLAEMLVEKGLRHAPVFTLTETILDDEGLLPESELGELRSWLSHLAEDERARSVVVRRTLSGALDSAQRRAADLADASSAQAQTVQQLNAILTRSYAEALDEVAEAVSDGTLLRGEVLARWQQYVGTGQMLRQLEVSLGRLRDRFTAAVKGQPLPAAELGEALQSGVAQLLTAQAESAAIAVTRRWRAVPGGAAVVLSHPGLSVVPPDFSQRTEALVRGWQSDILDLVRSEGKDRRTTARLLAFGVNAVGVVLMLVVFSHTMGLSGGEVGIAGGSAVLAQRLLEAIFGDQAVRTLADKARALLIARAKELYAAEQARLQAALEAVQVDPDQAERLMGAVAALRMAP